MKNAAFLSWCGRFERLLNFSPVFHTVVAIFLLASAYCLALFLLGLGLYGTWIALEPLFTQQGRVSPWLAFYSGAFTFVVGASLWVKVEAPKGKTLTPADAPDLFKFLDEMAAKGAPRIDKVLVNAEFNAGLSQIPLLGIFGWHKNCLCIGMPLLQVLSLDQAKAVLAHELGHAWGGDSRRSAWYYRSGQTWAGLAVFNSNSGPIFKLLTFPAAWIANMIGACVLPVARRQERLSDRYAAENVSAEALAQGLILLHSGGQQWFNPWFQEFMRRVPFTEDVPPGFHGEFRERLAKAPLAVEIRRVIAALRRRTLPRDTHPSLFERLKLLGQEAGQPVRQNPSAAEVFFGHNLEGMLKDADAQLALQFGALWKAAFPEAKRSWDRLNELEVKAAEGLALDWETRREMAALVCSIRGPEAAKLIYKGLCAENPSSALAAMEYGGILVAELNPEGKEWLEKAQKLDPALSFQAQSLLAQFDEERGHNLWAEGHHESADEIAERNQALLKRLIDYSTWEAYRPPDLSPWQREHLSSLFALHPEIQNVHVVRRSAKFKSEAIARAIFVRVKRRWWKAEDELNNKLAQELVKQITLDGVFGIHVKPGFGFLINRRLKRLDGAKVYDCTPFKRKSALEDAK